MKRIRKESNTELDDLWRMVNEYERNEDEWCDQRVRTGGRRDRGRLTTSSSAKRSIAQKRTKFSKTVDRACANQRVVQG